MRASFARFDLGLESKSGDSLLDAAREAAKEERHADALTLLEEALDIHRLSHGPRSDKVAHPSLPMSLFLPFAVRTAVPILVF